MFNDKKSTVSLKVACSGRESIYSIYKPSQSLVCCSTMNFYRSTMDIQLG